MEYGFQQLRGNRENIKDLVPGKDIFEGQLLISKDEKSIYALVDGSIQKLSEIVISESEPIGAERGKIFFDTALKTVKIHNAENDTYESIAGGSGDTVAAGANGYITVNGNPLKVFDDSTLRTLIGGKSDKTVTDSHESRIATLENRAIGDQISDSLTNGNIKVNNLELNVYDDTNIRTMLANKQDAGNYALKSVTDNHETRITTLENKPDGTSTGSTINDNSTSLTETWSASKISTSLSGKQASGDYATNTALTNGLAGKENAFSKNTGFNLPLGTTANTVSEGNHNHDTQYGSKANEHNHLNKSVLDKFSENGSGVVQYNGQSIGGGIAKYANISAMPANASIGDLAVDLSQFKLCMYKTASQTNLIPNLTSDTQTIDGITYSVSATSINSAPYSPWRMFQTSAPIDTTDCYASGAKPYEASPQIITLDAGHLLTFGNYTIWNRTDNAGGVDIRSWRAEISVDNQNWTTVDTQSGYIFPSGNYQANFLLSAPQSFRYFRLVVTDNAGNGSYFVISRIILNGSSNSWQVM